MGATLDKAVKAYVTQYMELDKKEGSEPKGVRDEAAIALHETMMQRIKEEVRCEMTVEEIEKQKSRIDAETENYATQKGVQELKTFILEGIGLAIVVGLIVNQFTDIITYLKGAENYRATVWVLFGLAGIVGLYVSCRLASLINKLINRKDG